MQKGGPMATEGDVGLEGPRERRLAGVEIDGEPSAERGMTVVSVLERRQKVEEGAARQHGGSTSKS